MDSFSLGFLWEIFAEVFFLEGIFGGNVLKDIGGGIWRGWWRILVETFCTRFCAGDFMDYFGVAMFVQIFGVFYSKDLDGVWTAVCDPNICM